MTTREVVDALYAAFLAGDGEGMIALMAEDVEVTFLGQGTFHGIPEVRRFMTFSASLLRDVDFRIGTIVVDGDVGSAVWEETATTRDGRPWENHGVDVIRVRDGRVVALHENNDVRLVREHFPPYEEDPA
jgi:ketosteroid isomerase-like protein